MEWNDIAETKYESVIKALNEAYQAYDKWFTAAGRHWPRDYYLKNGSYIHVVGDAEPDYTTLISSNRACGKSLTAMMGMVAAHTDGKSDQSTVSIKPIAPTISFDDLYGEVK